MSLPKKIGVNLLYLVPGKVGGTEIYARELIRELAQVLSDTEFVAYCGREAAEPLSRAEWPANVRIHKLPVNCSDKPLRILAETTQLPWVAARSGIKLIHSMGTTGVPFSVGVRVLTVHDLIYHHHSASVPKLAKIGLELVVPFSAKRSHRVLADSEATKLDLVDSYGLDADSIDVVYLGLGYSAPAKITDEATLRERWQLSERPVVLCVAAALAHKNIPRLFEAFATIDKPGDGAAPVLVIAGHAGLEHDNWQRLSEELGIVDDVRFTGWVEDEDLEGLYRLAACFAYPTLYEGFGMPVLEAMQRGTPVVCSNTTSLPEVAGDAALTFDPLDVDAIGAAINRVLADPSLAADLVARGHERVKQFTWRATAEATIRSYERAWDRYRRDR
ncbi:MAG: glycosyltransferase family 4 protein [Thermoleophilia bacterium]|nr:glycosyltransferase family 4 protein [Thermoleophilia bacterium]